MPEFLNVDLEIESRESLDILAQEFGDRVHILYNDYYKDDFYLLSLEIYAGHDPDPDSIINVFCDLMVDMSTKAQRVWRKSSARRFDVGIASGMADKKKIKALSVELKPETLQRISALSAQIVITVYPLTSLPKPKKK